MRIEEVNAHAFGPFSDRKLDLAPKMTVICGPNESGKSTWHAAVYAGLCGIRRGRGKARPEDEDFEYRHRPWDSTEWEVSAVVRLEDGRRVELHHDLSNKISRVRDVDLGRDYSGEIINEGSPDGACWLGLDRRSFLSTACVRQADIQSVLDQASALQEHMQRAASTAGTDATAAAALAALDSFRRENVGQDRRNSTRPLRVAMDEFERAQYELQQARDSHTDYVSRLEEVEKLKNDVQRAERELRIVEAARARREASQTLARLERAKELISKYPECPRPENQDDEKAQTARLALDRWNHLPARIDLTGPSAQELQDQLAKLPLMPDDDIAPRPEVLSAKNEFLLAGASLESHQREMPAGPVKVDAGGLTPNEIRNIATELRLQEPAIDLSLQERLEQAQRKVDGFSQPKRQTVGEEKPSNIPLFLKPFVLIARLVVKVFRVLFGGRPGSGDTTGRLEAVEELRSAETALGQVRFQITDVRSRHEKASVEASAHGLPADPAMLDELAVQVEQAEKATQDLARWRERENKLKEKLGGAEAALEAILRARGLITTYPVSGALEIYEAACAERDRQAREASRRPGLESVLASRRHQETLATNAALKRDEANVSLRQVAGGLAVQGSNDEDLLVKIQAWLNEYDKSAPDRRRATLEWDELQNLLATGGIEDLEEAASKQGKTAEEFAQGLDFREVEEAVLDSDSEAQLRALRQSRSDLREALTDKQARLDEFAATVPSVAEAEEAEARTQAELRRVKGLDQVLATTQEFLEQAQDKVHRTLAPLLRDSLKPWLQAVTGGRYADVTVDAETLMVQVSGDGRNWRDAALLSHGTSEQIYLLLRVGMARILTKPGEVCPLIFDDVTVHCDPARQTEILDILHAVSREQQVILFSQEPETLAWAKGHLSGDGDRLIELDAKGIPA